MVLTNEEKRTTWIAAAGGVAVLLIYFVGLPLWNRWTALGAALEPKVQLLAKLQERANAQNALLARRDALARELGAMEGRAAPIGPPQGMPIGPTQGMPPGPVQGMPAGPTQGRLHGPPPGMPVGAVQGTPNGPAQSMPIASVQGKPPAAPPPGAEKAQKSMPATTGLAMPAAPAAPPGAPPHSVAVSAYVERQAGTVGIRFNSVTSFTPTLGYKDGKSLKPAGVVVTLETATPALLRLLYALERGDRLLRIERMEIHHDLKKGPMITATLHIVGYEAAAR